MAKYIRNRGGAVHSLTDEGYDALLEVTDDGEKYLPHGYADISEDEAREAHPQLFGAADPNVESARVDLGYNQPRRR